MSLKIEEMDYPSEENNSFRRCMKKIEIGESLNTDPEIKTLNFIFGWQDSKITSIIVAKKIF